LNLKIDNDGVNLKIKSDDGDVELKVNKNGLTIK
jgi:hypothetical protein